MIATLQMSWPIYNLGMLRELEVGRVGYSK